MWISRHWIPPAIIWLFTVTNLAYGQNALSENVHLSNTPVLFKVAGKIFQQFFTI
jgi:hypothetical protein